VPKPFPPVVPPPVVPPPVPLVALGWLLVEVEDDAPLLELAEPLAD
jgi:hypothetical protein